ncbi:MAG: PD-(D/E)XK nuclease family protein [Clostridia bacterium]
MLNIYGANSYKNASSYILGLLSKVNPLSLAHKHIVLVPDRASMSFEQLILDKLGGSFNIEVLTIRRFATRILPQCNYLNKQSALMALSAIINRQKDNFCCYKLGYSSAGFAENIYEIICQLKYSRIPPEKIKVDLLPPSIKSKLQDIVLIYSEYEKYLSSGYIDSASKLEMLIEAISTSQFIASSYFYLCDFESLSVQEQAIIGELAKYSLNITTAVLYSQDKSTKHLFPNDCFSQLVELAEQLGVDKYVQTEQSFDSDFSRQMSKVYCYDQVDKLKVSPDQLTIYALPTVNDEVVALAQHISSHVRQGGRYKDYYCVLSDVEKYRLSVQQVFKEYDIPFFMDYKDCLYNHPICQYLVDYLVMFKNNFKQDNVFNFVKNCLFGMTRQVALFENYCLKYNVSYNFFNLTLGKLDKMVDYNSAIAVSNRLAQLTEIAIKPIDTATNYCIALKQIASEIIPASQQFDQLCLSKGLTRYVASSKQASNKLNQVLDELTSSVGEIIFKLEEFIKVLSTGLVSKSISVLPLTNDCVVFTNMARARKHDINILALLGANQNAMPIVKKDTKLLNDKSIELLKTYGVDLQYSMYLENKREKISLYQLLQEPKHLYVSYSLKQSSVAVESVALPSNFIGYLTKLFTKDCDEYPVYYALDERIYTVNLAKSAVITNARKIKDKVKVTSVNCDLLNKFFGDVVKQFEYKQDADNISSSSLLLEGDATSISKIECFYECPYKHYLRYGLRLAPREVAELDPRLFGIILHAVLEQYVSKFDRAESEQQTIAKTNNIFKSIMSQDFYSSITQDSVNSATIRLLQKECCNLALQIKGYFLNSNFVNYGAEVGFGVKNGIFEALKVEGTDIKLKGVVDRIDVYKNYFVCIDYKSSFASANYKESLLYMGRKLQLLIYLIAVKDKLYPDMTMIPLGFYYLPLSDRFTSQDKKEREFSFVGRSIDDFDGLTNLDTRLLNGKSKLLSVGLKNNELTKSPNSSSLITTNQLNSQMSYAIYCIKQAERLLKCGYIKQAPITSREQDCKGCDFVDICKASDLANNCMRKDYTSIKPADIEKIMQKGEQ